MQICLLIDRPFKILHYAVGTCHTSATKSYLRRWHTGGQSHLVLGLLMVLDATPEWKISLSGSIPSMVHVISWHGTSISLTCWRTCLDYKVSGSVTIKTSFCIFNWLAWMCLWVFKHHFLNSIVHGFQLSKLCCLDLHNVQISWLDILAISSVFLSLEAISLGFGFKTICIKIMPSSTSCWLSDLSDFVRARSMHACTLWLEIIPMSWCVSFDPVLTPLWLIYCGHEQKPISYWIWNVEMASATAYCLHDTHCMQTTILWVPPPQLGWQTAQD